MQNQTCGTNPIPITVAFDQCTAGQLEPPARMLAQEFHSGPMKVMYVALLWAPTQVPSPQIPTTNQTSAIESITRWKQAMPMRHSKPM